MTVETRRYKVRRALPGLLVAIACVVLVAGLLAISLGSPASLPLAIGLAAVSVTLLILAVVRLRDR
ncbi:hypothetical protein GCM10009793_35140 [Brachybacterium phenoliresistens]